MIQLKVRKIGNSLGVVLPKEVVQVLRAAEGDMLHLTEAITEKCSTSAFAWAGTSPTSWC